MKPNIAKTLQSLIKEKYPKIFAWDEVDAFAKQYGFKTETCRRKLEKDISPMIEHVFSGKGAVNGYRYKAEYILKEEVKESWENIDLNEVKDKIAKFKPEIGNTKHLEAVRRIGQFKTSEDERTKKWLGFKILELI